MLKRARENYLKLNKNKSKIRKPDEEKIRPVTQLPTPENKQELQRFLGVVQYLAKFIPNLSDISAPLRKLPEKNKA